MTFLNDLDPLLKTFWFVALPASIIFLIQTIMTFVGADASDGTEVDFDGDFDGGDAPFQLFSLRNLINFLLGFSWGGISFFSSIPNKGLLVFVALLIGIFFVFIFFVIIKQIQKLSEDNSFTYASTLDKTADVYTPIPENRSGKGKVMVSVKGAFHELEAMTEGERLATGTAVKVIRIENENLLIVQKL